MSLPGVQDLPRAKHRVGQALTGLRTLSCASRAPKPMTNGCPENWNSPRQKSPAHLISVGEILLDPKQVNAGYGDVKSINATAFGDIGTAVAKGTCPLTHQASFLEGFILDAKNADGETPTVAPDGDVWAFIAPQFNEGDPNFGCRRWRIRRGLLERRRHCEGAGIPGQVQTGPIAV